ncbi:hypothetical protein, partial [Malacoplasma iowae]
NERMFVFIYNQKSKIDIDKIINNKKSNKDINIYEEILSFNFQSLKKTNKFSILKSLKSFLSLIWIPIISIPIASIIFSYII